MVDHGSRPNSEHAPDLPAAHAGDQITAAMTEHEDRLRSFALHDERFLQSVLGIGADTVEASRLDPKTHALVRIGALLAVDAAPSSYQSGVDAAFAAGASVDEVVGTVVAVAPTVGLARIVSAAPELALALGYDVDAALEAPESPEPGLSNG